jgi:hypothetical protein
MAEAMASATGTDATRLHDGTGSGLTVDHDHRRERVSAAGTPG